MNPSFEYEHCNNSETLETSMPTQRLVASTPPLPLEASASRTTIMTSKDRNPQQQHRLPPKKRKVEIKHSYKNVPSMPMTILLRQVASSWPCGGTGNQTTIATAVSGSPFYLERYGEKALHLYPKGPQTMEARKSLFFATTVTPKQEQQQIIETSIRKSSSRRVAITEIPEKSFIVTATTPAAATTMMQQSSSSSSRQQGVVTPLPCGMMIDHHHDDPSGASLTNVCVSPVRRRGKSSKKSSSFLQGSSADFPIEIDFDNNHHRGKKGYEYNFENEDDTATQTSFATNRAVSAGFAPSLAARRVYPVPLSVSQVQYSTPQDKKKTNRRHHDDAPDLDATWHPSPQPLFPRPTHMDRTTTWPAFRPIAVPQPQPQPQAQQQPRPRKVSMSHGGDEFATPSAAHDSPFQHAASVPQHPLYNANHSGRRSAAFAPQHK